MSIGREKGGQTIEKTEIRNNQFSLAKYFTGEFLFSQFFFLMTPATNYACRSNGAADDTQAEQARDQFLLATT